MRLLERLVLRALRLAIVTLVALYVYHGGVR
jgi:hypothetical protein